MRGLPGSGKSHLAKLIRVRSHTPTHTLVLHYLVMFYFTDMPHHMSIMSDGCFLQDKEVEFGGAPPRVLGLDDYFMTEVEKEEKDPDTGKRVKTKVWIQTCCRLSRRNLFYTIKMEVCKPEPYQKTHTFDQAVTWEWSVC